MTKDQSTFLKGIAVISVIISHLICGGYELRLFTPFGGIGVALFLVLSGYGLNESYHNSGLTSFWQKKLTRIGVPWLIWCGLFLFIGLVVPSLSKKHFLIRYWYLEYLITWCLIFWTGRLVLRERKAFVVLLAISSVAMFFVWPTLQAEQSFSFLTGVLLSEGNRRPKRITADKPVRWVKLLPYCLFVFATVFLVIKQLPIVRLYGEQSLLMKVVQLNIKLPYAMSLLSFFLLNTVPMWSQKLIMPAGVLSLELYLVQMMFFTNIQGRFWVLLVDVAVIIGFSLLLHYIAGKVNTLLKPVWVKI